MKITIKEINKNNSISINSKEELYSFLNNSYNTYKTIKGFNLFLNDYFNHDKNEYIVIKKYLLDHKSYDNLFVAYDDLTNILNYVEDTCEARGEQKPSNINEAINYLKNEKTIIYEIIEFNISKIELDSFNEIYRLKKNKN